VQVFEPDASGLVYQSVKMWDVDAWSSDSLDNKPFLALDENSSVYLTDPDRGRVIVFDSEGQFQRIWGGFDNSFMMNVISGITIGDDGSVWVSDALSNTLLKFVLP
jgi:hypothetical protein